MQVLRDVNTRSVIKIDVLKSLTSTMITIRLKIKIVYVQTAFFGNFGRSNLNDSVS